MKINSIVILSETEQKICASIAKLRSSNARGNNVTNAKIGNKSDEEMDLEGVSSEFAFCKLFNLYPDLTIEVRSSRNDTDHGDAVLSDGRTVDVKSTHYPNGKLLAASWKKTNVDLFALMIGKSPTYTFKGFMRSEELIHPTKLGDLGYGKGYIAQQSELKELENC